MSSEVARFRIEIADVQLRYLRARQGRTRRPDAETAEDKSRGVPRGYTQELTAYWADGYDWRATKDRLNAVPQLHTELEGLWIHFRRVRSPHPDALPLIIMHGWPGSIVEFLKVIWLGRHACIRSPRRVWVSDHFGVLVDVELRLDR